MHEALPEIPFAGTAPPRVWRACQRNRTGVESRQPFT